MPSNVRKGHVFQTKSTKKPAGGIKGDKKPGDKASGDKRAAESKATCCHFLELPAEIRNRIYHFARETVYDDDCLAPPLLVRHPKIAASRIAVPSILSTLCYRALTQVCKQIRTEYRPIWLRQSCFRMQLPTVAQFLNTYYPHATDYHSAPKLLIISWDHGRISGDEYDDFDEESMEDVLTDITLLIRLRAHCPTSTVKLVSHQTLEDDLPNVECDECGHSIHCGCDNDSDHEDALYEAHWRMRWSYGYLEALNVFLANSNEKWLRLFRDAGYEEPLIGFTIDINNQRLIIYIRFEKGQAPGGFKLKSMYKSALTFLHLSGMLDLDDYDEFEYVIGEATGRYTRHAAGYGSLSSTYNQIHLDNTTLVHWKAEKDSKASSS